MDESGPCDACLGKRYIVSLRDDSVCESVERCDACWDGESDFYDEDAAKLAQADGIVCRSEYPCYVGPEEDWRDDLARWQGAYEREEAKWST